MESHTWKANLRRRVRSVARRMARQIPALRTRSDELAAARHGARFAPPGHFHSPIPSDAEIAQHAARLFTARPRTLPGIDLNEAGQLALLEEIASYYHDLPFPAQPTPGHRYYFANDVYSYSDAICLYGMLRHARPRRILEVGSGFSSCAMLDVNERYFDSQIACTFVDPDPERLLSLITPADRGRVEILPTPMQTVPLDRFRALTANDILFIDSTHVAKLGSDVCHLFGQVLPILQPGVYVHVHDIFYPFEYPPDWLAAGRAWNETYLLRAFLTFNTAYRIVLCNTFLETFHREVFEARLPLCLKNEGGSIWLQRRA
jgi:hypothetical protein